jgi:hypothetical protein
VVVAAPLRRSRSAGPLPTPRPADRAEQGRRRKQWDTRRRARGGLRRPALLRSVGPSAIRVRAPSRPACSRHRGGSCVHLPAITRGISDGVCGHPGDAVGHLVIGTVTSRCCLSLRCDASCCCGQAIGGAGGASAARPRVTGSEFAKAASHDREPAWSGQEMPLRTAWTAAWMRLSRWSLARMLATWLETVLVLSESWRAMS